MATTSASAEQIAASKRLRERSYPRVLLVDDHDLFRNCLRALLADQHVDVVGEASTGTDALAALRTLAPEVVVMDLNMPGLSGVQTIDQMTRTAPLTRILVLTASDEHADVLDAIVAGACGYLLKDASVEVLVAGICAAANGESLISPTIAAKVLRHIRDAGASEREAVPVRTELSDRETQVLRLIAAGKDNSQIAADLFISPKTVKNHISNILMKLQINNRIQAAVFAVRNGIV
jgi:DNA-binding NarL/FixJ family response regulator